MGWACACLAQLMACLKKRVCFGLPAIKRQILQSKGCDGLFLAPELFLNWLSNE